jgi:D-alanyl-D-alanine carboxypeptidase/D-alanyl-D-alanine-endopeptidase (penicillin-binding protein 4)
MLRKSLTLIGCVAAWCTAQAQTGGLAAKLKVAYQRFAARENLRYASIGFLVQDENGKTIFASGEQTGLAPASCLKIVTAATALDKLGTGYRFATQIQYSGRLADGVLQGDLLVDGSGDPTMGSWRFSQQPDNAFFEQVLTMLRQKAIKRITGDVVGSNTRFGTQPVPDGWIYADMGNYYGAGSWALNYRENQFDLSFNTSGAIGSKIVTSRSSMVTGYDSIYSFVTVGAAGSGDNSIIYAAPYSYTAYVKGTLGRQSAPFRISGSLPFGELTLLEQLKQYLQANGIEVAGAPRPALYYLLRQTTPPKATGSLGTYQSVGLDSIVYWFMQKSINLYGEALIRHMAMAEGKPAETDEGVALLREYWAARGIDRHALKPQDGSGLSPQNRVTAQALVQVLQYARKQAWFSTYLHAFPLIHNIKMKSGTIGGAKGYVGYVQDKSGKQYSFALLVNNYSGKASAVVNEMFALLDTIVNN